MDFSIAQQRAEVLLDCAGSVGDHPLDGAGVWACLQTRKDDLLLVDIHSNVLYRHGLCPFVLYVTLAFAPNGTMRVRSTMLQPLGALHIVSLWKRHRRLERYRGVPR